MKMDIVFENSQFVAINKPSGLLSIPDRTQSEPSLKDMLKEKYGEIYTVHRLDKNTSGLIVFAKDAETHKALSALFENRATEKFYIGLINGTFVPENGIVDAAIAENPAERGTMMVHSKGKPSLTEYKTLEKFKSYSLVQFQIHTGRTHQIRVHAHYLGHTIVCDDIYGDNKPVFISAIKKSYNLAKKEMEERPILGRLALHSARLHFTLSGQSYDLEAPLPKDIRATLVQLRKNNAVK